MQRPLSETAWLRKIGTQDSKCPLSSRFVKLQASLLGDSILAYYLTNPISWCSREPRSAFWQMVFSMYPESNNSRTTYRGYLCKGIGLSVFLEQQSSLNPFCDSNLEVVSNQNPAPGWSVWIGEVFCQYTWKTVKFRSLQSSGNDPIRWSVMIDLKCLFEFSRDKEN